MEPTHLDSQDERWLRRLFFALALLYLVPFWTVHYLPTVDGPCHTYNAWVIRHYADIPLFQQHYEINTRPYPNWIGHAVLALLMFVVPPLLAEKLLVSLYVLLFLGGAWYLAGSVRTGTRWLAFLAFPFVYNQMFQFGFYNFSISLALFLWILGFWWRRRERVDLRYVLGMNLLLFLCYFSHIVSFALSLFAIAILWLATLPRAGRAIWRRHLLHIPALAPQLILPLWYVTTEGAATTPDRGTSQFLIQYILNLRVLALGEAQRSLAVALAVAFLVLLLATLWRENLRPQGNPRPVLREADAFLLLALAFAGLYFFGPGGGLGGGTHVKPRLSLYPWLLLIPWLAPPVTRRARGLAVAALALVAVLNLGYVTLVYRTLSGQTEAYLAGLAPVPPNSRLLPLLFEHGTPSLWHAASYAALEKNLIDWDNFEASYTRTAPSHHFPTFFRPSAPPPPYEEIELRPDSLPLEVWQDRADYIYTWQMPPNDPFIARLQEHYNLVSATEGGALWERR